MSKTITNLIQETIGNRPTRYGRLPIPHLYDEVLAAAVQHFRDLTEEERARLNDSLTLDDMRALRMFAERMANLAVRSNDPDCIANGLMALVIEDFRFDYREDYLILSLLYRSGELLNRSSREFFEEAARYASPTVRDHLLQFAKHPSTIGQMGYTEMGSGAEFRYKRDW
jgi:hypothetical protein